jgi:hypothetical protein
MLTVGVSGTPRFFGWVGDFYGEYLASFVWASYWPQRAVFAMWYGVSQHFQCSRESADRLNRVSPFHHQMTMLTFHTTLLQALTHPRATSPFLPASSAPGLPLSRRTPVVLMPLMRCRDILDREGKS